MKRETEIDSKKDKFNIEHIYFPQMVKQVATVFTSDEHFSLKLLQV